MVFSWQNFTVLLKYFETLWKMKCVLPLRNLKSAFFLIAALCPSLSLGETLVKALHFSSIMVNNFFLLPMQNTSIMLFCFILFPLPSYHNLWKLCLVKIFNIIFILFTYFKCSESKKYYLEVDLCVYVCVLKVWTGWKF